LLEKKPRRKRTGRPVGSKNVSLKEKADMIEDKLKLIQNKVLKELHRRTMDVASMNLDDITKVLRVCRDGLAAAHSAKQGRWGEEESSIKFVSYMAGRPDAKNKGHKPGEPEEASAETGEVGLQADAETVDGAHGEGEV